MNTRGVSIVFRVVYKYRIPGVSENINLDLNYCRYFRGVNQNLLLVLQMVSYFVLLQQILIELPCVPPSQADIYTLVKIPPAYVENEKKKKNRAAAFEFIRNFIPPWFSRNDFKDYKSILEYPYPGVRVRGL